MYLQKIFSHKPALLKNAVLKKSDGKKSIKMMYKQHFKNVLIF